MKLEKFKKNKKQKYMIIGGLVGILLVIGSIILYKTYAYYEEAKTYNVLQGKVGDFGYDIKLAVTLDGVKQDSVPARGLYKTEISCKDGNGNQVSTGTWDYNNWSLTVENLQYETKCNVTFTSNLTQEEYNKYIDAGIAHRRNTYRGKDITSYLTATGEDNLYTQISNGTFDDIYVGDYFTVDYAGTPTVFLVADIDNYYGTGFDDTLNQCKIVNGDTNETANCFRLKKHHITIIPAKPILKTPMNATDTTEGGYTGSDMVKTTLVGVETNLKSTFDNHLLQYSNVLSTKVDASRISSGLGSENSGASSEWSWHLRYVDLMSEPNVSGTSAFSSSGHDIGIDNRQYAIFQLKPEFINGYKEIYFAYWLKGVSSLSNFAVASDNGRSDSGNASYILGVRPRFLIG